MGRLLVLLFGTIVVTTAAGVDFYAARRAQTDEPYTLRDHLAARSGGLTGDPAPEEAPTVAKVRGAASSGKRQTVTPLSSQGCSTRSASKFCKVTNN